MNDSDSQNELLKFQQDFLKLEQDQARLQKIRQPQVKRTGLRIDDLLNHEQNTTKGCEGDRDDE